VHGDLGRPEYLAADVELVSGDVRDAVAVRGALAGVESVVHLAARVGVGQSMYEMAEYTSANSVGTAVLLEALAENPVRKLVVASSMSIYGEGLYLGSSGRAVEPEERSREQLERREWDYPGLEPVATPEGKRPGL
jgi:dTDP-L-rhamnose 4-epimerase